MENKWTKSWRQGAGPHAVGPAFQGRRLAGCRGRGGVRVCGSRGASEEPGGSLLTSTAAPLCALRPGPGVGAAGPSPASWRLCSPGPAWGLPCASRGGGSPRVLQALLGRSPPSPGLPWPRLECPAGTGCLLPTGVQSPYFELRFSPPTSFPRLWIGRPEPPTWSSPGFHLLRGRKRWTAGTGVMQGSVVLCELCSLPRRLSGSAVVDTRQGRDLRRWLHRAPAL